MARYKHAVDKKLRLREDRYRGFVQNFLGIAFRFAPDFSVIFLHGPTEYITGYKEDDFMTGTISGKRLLHPDNVDCILPQNTVIRQSREYAGSREYRILRKDGEVLCIFELLQKLPATQLLPSYIQEAFYDIPARKIAQGCDSGCKPETQSHQYYNAV